MERKIWVDGELVRWEAASVHILSQSVQRGTLVFDVAAVYGTPDAPRVLGLREHVDRFLRSAALSGMELELDREAVLRAIGDTLRANPPAAIVKLSAYWPSPSLDVLPTDARPSVAIAVFDFRDVPSGAPHGAEPACLMLADTIKLPPGHLSPQVKIAAGYTASSFAKRVAVERGMHDVLLLDERGNIAESSTQSFFLVHGGVVRTAPLEYVLAGITRHAVLDLAAAEGISVKEEPLPRDALETADEAFLAGTSLNVWPVARIDSLSLPSPVPGPLTARLQARFDRMIAGGDPELSPRWLQSPP